MLEGGFWGPDEEVFEDLGRRKGDSASWEDGGITF